MHEAHVVEDKNSHKLRHYQMGHMSEVGLGELSQRALIPMLKKEDKVGKQCRVSFQESNHRANKLVHSDVWGPCTRGGARYFLTFTDDYSRKSWFYLLREKNEVQALERLKSNQTMREPNPQRWRIH